MTKTAVTRLTLATPNVSEFEDFADAVQRLSHGSVVIVPKVQVHAGTRDAQQLTFADAAAGRVDIAFVTTTSIDDLGIAGLDGLSAPLLVDSYALERRALALPELTAALASLRRAGVVGLGIVPGPLRHPIGIGRMLRGPAEWRGVVIASPQSAYLDRVYAALGATPRHYTSLDDIGPRFGGVAYAYNNLPDNSAVTTAIATANVVLWPRPQVLAMGVRRFETLPPGVGALLERAAREAADLRLTALERHDDDEDASRACALGMRVTMASAGDIAALTGALAPITASIRADPASAALLGAIERAKASMPPAAPPSLPCGAGAASSEVTAKTLAQLEGTYRFVQTAAELEAAGLDTATAELAASGSEFVLRHGRLTYHAFDFDPWQCTVASPCSMTGRYRWTGTCLQINIDVKDSAGDQGCYHVTLFRDRLLLDGPLAPLFGNGHVDATLAVRLFYTNIGRGWPRVRG